MKSRGLRIGISSVNFVCSIVALVATITGNIVAGIVFLFASCLMSLAVSVLRHRAGQRWMMSFASAALAGFRCLLNAKRIKSRKN